VTLGCTQFADTVVYVEPVLSHPAQFDDVAWAR
jgi:hypothetical protein